MKAWGGVKGFGGERDNSSRKENIGGFGLRSAEIIFDPLLFCTASLLQILWHQDQRFEIPDQLWVCSGVS